VGVGVGGGTAVEVSERWHRRPAALVFQQFGDRDVQQSPPSQQCSTGRGRPAAGGRPIDRAADTPEIDQRQTKASQGPVCVSRRLPTPVALSTLAASGPGPLISRPLSLLQRLHIPPNQAEACSEAPKHPSTQAPKHPSTEAAPHVSVGLSSPSYSLAPHMHLLCTVCTRLPLTCKCQCPLDQHLHPALPRPVARAPRVCHDGLALHGKPSALQRLRRPPPRRRRRSSSSAASLCQSREESAAARRPSAARAAEPAAAPDAGQRFRHGRLLWLRQGKQAPCLQSPHALPPASPGSPGQSHSQGQNKYKSGGAVAHLLHALPRPIRRLPLSAQFPRIIRASLYSDRSCTVKFAAPRIAGFVGHGF
jgi:hypothetical protein